MLLIKKANNKTFNRNLPDFLHAGLYAEPIYSGWLID